MPVGKKALDRIGDELKRYRANLVYAHAPTVPPAAISALVAKL